ncbi:TorD/DmsD family molecular chaperone [Salinilacihabitans rarus]|uniref:TorD/DmsD family molecular chaperone n=1 Tax=Salinilacihabitans rarus TaxID=2961596 RepID=UPI0020C92B30|nr:molecular chaperone TorD family protein [Salinilacihabitans rarus]
MTAITTTATARVYRTLGEVYLEPPTADQLDALGEWADAWLTHADGTLPANVESPLETIRETDRDDVEDVSPAFPRLFRGLSEASPDPPYESLYREGTIYGASTTAVRNEYREAGLDITDDDEHEPADHVGIELQFLGELRAREASGDVESVERQRTFIRDHLEQWFGEFKAAVLQSNPPEHYAAVVRLTDAVLSAESERLEVVVTETA